MATHHDQAICIRHWDWSETSQTVSLFARDHGIIRGIAKGARREHSTFSGGIELMTRGEVVVSLKATDALSTLTAWDLQETFRASRATLAGFYGGMAILDIVQHSLQPGDPHPEFFDAAVSGLRALAVAGKEREAVLSVLWRALVETGHAPQLSIDIRSGESLADVPVYGFWPGLGGFSVETTPPSLMAEPNLQTVWKVRRETLHFLRGETPIVDPDAATDTTRRAMQLLLAYFRWVFSDEVRALTQFVALTAPTP